LSSSFPAPIDFCVLLRFIARNPPLHIPSLLRTRRIRLPQTPIFRPYCD
jgi:hypothetical protein